MLAQGKTRCLEEKPKRIPTRRPWLFVPPPMGDLPAFLAHRPYLTVLGGTPEPTCSGLRFLLSDESEHGVHGTIVQLRRTLIPSTRSGGGGPGRSGRGTHTAPSPRGAPRAPDAGRRSSRSPA